MNSSAVILLCFCVAIAMKSCTGQSMHKLEINFRFYRPIKVPMCASLTACNYTFALDLPSQPLCKFSVVNQSKKVKVAFNRTGKVCNYNFDSLDDIDSSSNFVASVTLEEMPNVTVVTIFNFSVSLMSLLANIKSTKDFMVTEQSGGYGKLTLGIRMTCGRPNSNRFCVKMTDKESSIKALSKTGFNETHKVVISFWYYLDAYIYELPHPKINYDFALEMPSKPHCKFTMVDQGHEMKYTHFKEGHAICSYYFDSLKEIFSSSNFSVSVTLNDTIETSDANRFTFNVDLLSKHNTILGGSYSAHSYSDAQLTLGIKTTCDRSYYDEYCILRKKRRVKNNV